MAEPFVFDVVRLGFFAAEIQETWLKEIVLRITMHSWLDKVLARCLV